MRVVRGNGGPNTGASPPALQPVEIPAAGALEEGGKGNGLESWPILAGTGVRAVFCSSPFTEAVPPRST